MSLTAGMKHPAFLPQFSRAMGGVFIAFLTLFLWMGLSGERTRQALIEQIPSETVIVQAAHNSKNDPAPEEALPHAAEQPHIADIHAEPQPAHNDPHAAPTSHDAAPEEHHVPAVPHEEQSEHAPPPAEHDGHHTATTDHHAETIEPPHISLAQPGLSETTSFGTLPMIREADGMTPFNAYKVAFTPLAGKFKFSAIIRDMGLSQSQTNHIIQSLPPYVTLAFSPYAGTSSTLLQAAQEKKQEIWLTLPLESKDPLTDDNGPLSLRADYNSASNMETMKTVLGTLEAYAGMISFDADHSGVKLDSPGFKSVLKEIFERGLGFAYQSQKASLDIAQTARPDQGTVIQIAQSYNLPFSETALQLDALLKAHHNVAVVLDIYPAQVGDLTTWLNDLPTKGYVLTPLSSQK